MCFIDQTSVMRHCTLSWQRLAENITPYSSAGTQLTVEVHPQDAMPQLLKKFSLAKRTYVQGYSCVMGWQGGLRVAGRVRAQPGHLLGEGEE